MTITEEKVVSLSYTLVVEGDVVETVKEDKPMRFIYGLGYLLPAFEKKILGKKVGDEFSFTLNPSEGYGEIDPNAVVELSKDIFKVNGKIEDGLLVKDKVIPMQDSGGNRLNGIVEDIMENSVKMNFNHPLAGCELHFSGKVVDIRQASEKELIDGLYGERAASSCGGSCDGCSGCN
ncbi:MAG: FKBP-type peptidyl-prolyl cis-trans isomerase [Bacteroidales bacterium]|jgi:FKBP-type peptidyl-prolyl cis-trans isomerase SlyD|nr:FKBP-type peptidyl-prolyl cis-trans isomerase [Bacteroidales bacterium]MDD2264020.1 FKBP-type peptidyl-prolyl cis-trans isomerase [Bacteroidales bacterium]MDD2831254.1 FKBP-type peptidyl-prolyl cis-trans isomerase [Bacteroidales bacterium]MDD3208633.1 FKBP-type peptidyl-prolyl cis-trans isomerase [Bacteroidales bacterium]MDD3697196.1 FKBP-type peptidyl-prolyl cis-trans isomerase [Bacteroidales bacterium]